MEEQYINCIGITLGESEFCISVFVGRCPIYLHGTTDQAREFARQIIEAADKYDRKRPTIPSQAPPQGDPSQKEVAI